MQCVFADVSIPRLLITNEDFVQYLRNWREDSDRAKAILAWQRCTPSELCAQSRPGAWLGDCLHTEWLVRLSKVRPNVAFVAVGNDLYKGFWKELGIFDSSMNSSSNNVGNQLEFLYWLAIEEYRYKWALSVSHLMARRRPSNLLEATTAGQKSAMPGTASNSRVVTGNAQSSSHVDSVDLQMTDAVADRSSLQDGVQCNPMQKCTLCNCWEKRVNKCSECWQWTCKTCTFWCTLCPKGNNRYQICRLCNDLSLYLRRRGRIWSCHYCHAA